MNAKRASGEKLTCSSCGRVNRRGVAGPHFFICFSCIDLLTEIKAEMLAEESST